MGSGYLSNRIEHRIQLLFSTLSGALSCLYFIRFISTAGLLHTILFQCWLELSIGTLIPAINTFGMNIPAQRDLGTASGFFRMFSTLGLALGVSIFSAVYSMHISSLPASSHIAIYQSLVGFRSAYIAGFFLQLVAFGFILMISGKRNISRQAIINS